MNHKYDDIIDLPRPTSAGHPRMSRRDRAAQFSPFSALAGYEEAIGESGRQTCRMIHLDWDAREALDRQLAYLRDHIGVGVSLTYFLPDEGKEGGTYVQTEDKVVKVDPLNQVLVLKTATVPMEAILNLQIIE